MAVRIRLTRRGRKGAAMYDVIVADSRSPRDGKFIEKLGTYNPNVNPIAVKLNHDRALYWLLVGALPTETTRMILSEEGLMLKKHLQQGVNKAAITQEQADAKFSVWLEAKTKKTDSKASSMLKKAEDSEKARFYAENQARIKKADEIQKKNNPVVEAEVVTESEAEPSTENAAE